MGYQELEKKGLNKVNKSISEFKQMRFFDLSSVEKYTGVLLGEIKMLWVLGLIDTRGRIDLSTQVRIACENKRAEVRSQ